MVPGLEWCERDGKRYLRMDYTVASGADELLAMNGELEAVVEAAAPRQRVLVVIDDMAQDGLGELFKRGLTAYRKVHHPRRTVFAIAGMPRAGAVTLRAFNAVGARGRLAGFGTEPEALDWLLSH